MARKQKNQTPFILFFVFLFDVILLCEARWATNQIYGNQIFLITLRRNNNDKASRTLLCDWNKNTICCKRMKMFCEG